MNELQTLSVEQTPLLKQAGALLVLEGLLLFVPLYILGTSINWPASLDERASVNLPLILENYGSMMAGYSIYLLYSVLFWPVAYLTGRVIVGTELTNSLFRIANGFAALSALARSLGIVRWLFTMPVLARFYVASDATQPTKETISILYELLNSYAGGVGELLGVSLFAVLWLILICVIIVRNSEWPSWLGYFGFITSTFLLLNFLEVLGVDLGPMITISVALLHLWLLTTAIVFFKKALRTK
jgi:hypothetical protein